MFSSVKEAIRIAEKSGCKSEISHIKLAGKLNWGKTDQLFVLLDSAISRGVPISWDQYPYSAWGASLIDYVPQWVQQKGRQKLVEYLSDKVSREKIRQEINDAIKLGKHYYNEVPWENIQIATIRSPKYQFTEGRRVSELARKLHMDPIDLIFDLLVAGSGTVKILGFCMDEKDIKTIMKHPKTIVASDGRAVADYGKLSKSSVHPRYYGTFPRILGKYVRDEKLLSLEAAIQKITSMPAEIMGLDDRGRLGPKMVADITIFDPKTVSDKATFENPHQYAAGIENVIISGNIVIDKGIHTNKMVGKVIK